MKVMNLVPYQDDVPGRIASELRRDKQSVIFKIFEEINRNALIMGISVDAGSAKANAVEAVDFIKNTFPTAHIDDICKSMRMGAYGQLRFDGQMNTLSASNIFQWYKLFRQDHQDKMVAPPAARLLPEPTITDNMKKEVVRESFINFITNPREYELIIPMHFDKLIQIGVLTLTDDEKRKAYLDEAFILVNNPPLDLMKDRKGRESVREYQTYYDSLEKKEDFKYHLYKDNPMHKTALFNAKKRIAINFLKNADKEQIIKLYDQTYG